jgi:hypothetical protein
MLKCRFHKSSVARERPAGGAAAAAAMQCAPDWQHSISHPLRSVVLGRRHALRSDADWIHLPCHGELQRTHMPVIAMQRDVPCDMSILAATSARNTQIAPADLQQL